MNGAAGVVGGFIWPQGGDPNSADEQKQAPLCVVVEFDDVDLGRDAEGKPRTFFPDVTLGLDKRGKERSLKCVPIFRQEVDAANLDGLGTHALESTGHDARSSANPPQREDGAAGWHWLRGDVTCEACEAPHL